MGKASNRRHESDKKAAREYTAHDETFKRKEKEPHQECPIYVAALTAIVMVLFAMWAKDSGLFHSSLEGRVAFPVRLFFCIMFQTTFQGLFSTLLLEPARAIARHLPGAPRGEKTASMWCGPSAKELVSHDPSLPWPHEASLSTLPAEWQALPSKATPQPYFLNHVRGDVRIKAAGMRLGMAVGSVVAIALNCWLLDERPLHAVGLTLDWGFSMDLLKGLATGTLLVLWMGAVEWGLGWIKFLGAMEVFAPGENFWLNLLWDFVFHCAVTVNEELPLRGWFLLNVADACIAYFGMTQGAALLVSCMLQSVIFSMMHIASPGASTLGLINLIIGGTAAALNVALSGSLAFGLAWHLGWNFTMGNLLGLSTSGIPISATLLSFAPHPQKAHLHGGTFGPEQSWLAPVSYVLGCLMLFAFYGTERYPSVMLSAT